VQRLRNASKAPAATTATDVPAVASRYAIVVIGGSAGGLESVRTILHALPQDFSSPILVVLHLHPKFTSHVAEILNRQTHLRVKDAEDNETLASGQVYTAPPNRHLLVNRGMVLLSETPAVNYSRPAIDRTFESVVKTYGSRVIGVVLSGSGRDGSEGLRAIKEAGGFAIVEDPLTARFTGMPTAAITASSVDRILPLDDIAPLLLELSNTRQDPAAL
jgi:two-component system chemotaxis response regulator CheB